MIVTSCPSLRTQTHLSYACDPSSLGTCGTTTEGVGVPMFEEHLGIGVHQAGEPSDGVSGTVCAVVVVPAGYFALVFVAAHMRGGAATEAALAIRGAILDLMPGLQFKAFVTECWVPDGRLFVRMVEGDIVFV